MSCYILCILKIQPKFRKYVICNWCQSNRKKKAKNTVRDLSEISRGEGGVGILNLGSEIR